MPKRNSQPKTQSFDAEAEISIIIDEYPPRVEECHGFHSFDESEEVDRELISFKIMVGETEINICDRLTPEEKQIILESSKDV